MDKYEITAAYAQFCASFEPDFYFVLNYQPHKGRELSFGELSRQVRQLFYQLEVDEWGYERRKSRRGLKSARIERLVCIERASAYHANILMKRYNAMSNDQLIQHIRSNWLEIQRMEHDADTSYLMNTSHIEIKNLSAVCAYVSKDTAKANARNEDVLCMRASFIRKHSNRR